MNLSSLSPRRAVILLLLTFIGALTACATTFDQRPVDVKAQIESRVNEFLTAYAANDQTTVLNLIDPTEFSMFGSDLAEIVHSPSELKQLMTDDFALWRNAKFGVAKDFDVRHQNGLATALFSVPFSAGGGPEVVIRVTSVWRKRDGQWLLTQSANSVPTVGSSARELLRK